MTATESLSFAPDLPLKFVGGDPSLDFVNTVDWTAAGLVHDRFVDYGRLLDWGGRAGVIERGDEIRLARFANDHRAAADAAVAHARRARTVLQRLFAALSQQRRSTPALDEFNELVRRASTHLALAQTDRASGVLEWRASRADDLDIVLWQVVRAAERLLTSDEAGKVRTCAGPDCGWVYVDRSRNGFRRWCEMKVCGTKAKSRRRAERREAPGR